MRLCDAYNKNVPVRRKETQVNSLFKFIVSLFSIRCPDCGAKMELVGFHGGMNGPSIYECSKCHRQWI